MGALPVLPKPSTLPKNPTTITPTELSKLEDSYEEVHRRALKWLKELPPPNKTMPVSQWILERYEEEELKKRWSSSTLIAKLATTQGALVVYARCRNT
jgi:hypothetical protein